MRVLLLSPSPFPRDVLQTLVARGVVPAVARAGGSNETDGVVEHLRVAARGDANRPADLRWSRRGLRTLLRDVRPDLVHISADIWTPTALAGAAAAKDLKLPYTICGQSSRGGPAGFTVRWQVDRARSAASGLAGSVRSALDHLVAGTDHTVPTAVLPSGGVPIPGSWQQRGESYPLVLAIAGRLVPERGADLLLTALSTTYGDWRLRIVGTGPDHEALEAQAQKLGLSSRIEWLGALPRAQLPSFWQQTDVIVAPSRSRPDWVEPTGAIILQAMAHGVAPIVTRCGALPSLVSDAGLIVDENDADALTRALQSLVSAPWRAREVGLLARQRVLEQYSDGAAADRLVGFWQQVLDGR